MHWVGAGVGAMKRFWFSLPWDDVARYAPIVTATIALTAALVALWSIHVQRTIARKRAAVDVFLKTEMDHNMIKAYDEFNDGCGALKDVADLESVSKTDHYRAVRKYLNIHELIAVGINNGIFDKKVCYYFWADVLTSGYKDALRVIDHARSEDGGRYTYTDLEKLNKRWSRPRWCRFGRI